MSAILAANVRVPELVLGEVAAMRAAIGVASRRLAQPLEASPGLDLTAIAGDVSERATSAFHQALEVVPNGSY